VAAFLAAAQSSSARKKSDSTSSSKSRVTASATASSSLPSCLSFITSARSRSRSASLLARWAWESFDAAVSRRFDDTPIATITAKATKPVASKPPNIQGATERD
jgi:hypothetical protein